TPCRQTPNSEENTMSGSKDRSFAPRHFALAGSVLAGLAGAPASVALAKSGQAIPPFSSANFGWQTNVADWQAPPPGSGHGPIKDDPAHPFTSNVAAARAGIQPTKRLGDAKDPVLKPWAAAQMQASNDEVLSG